MPLSIRRTSKKQRKLKNDVTKIESEDYDESSLQVKFTPVSLRNLLISVGLEPILSHTENLKNYV